MGLKGEVSSYNLFTGWYLKECNKKEALKLPTRTEDVNLQEDSEDIVSESDDSCANDDPNFEGTFCSRCLLTEGSSSKAKAKKKDTRNNDQVDKHPNLGHRHKPHLVWKSMSKEEKQVWIDMAEEQNVRNRTEYIEDESLRYIIVSHVFRKERIATLTARINDDMRQLLLNTKCACAGFYFNAATKEQIRIGSEMLKPFLKPMDANDKDTTSLLIQSRAGRLY